MTSMRQMALERNIRLVDKYSNIEVSTFDNIDIILFVVDNENDVNRHMRGVRRDTSLVMECINCEDKKSTARIIINFLDINIHNRKYKYNKINNQILLIKEK